MSEQPPISPAKRIFQACLFLLGAVVALTLAIDFMSHIWGWVVLVLIFVSIVWAVIWWHRARRDRW